MSITSSSKWPARCSVHTSFRFRSDFSDSGVWPVMYNPQRVQCGAARLWLSSFQQAMAGVRRLCVSIYTPRHLDRCTTSSSESRPTSTRSVFDKSPIIFRIVYWVSCALAWVSPESRLRVPDAVVSPNRSHRAGIFCRRSARCKCVSGWPARPAIAAFTTRQCTAAA